MTAAATVTAPVSSPATLLTPGQHHRLSEFVYDDQQARWLTGTCGPTALAVAAWNATGQPHDVLSVYRLMRANGLCDINGGSTPGGLATAAGRLGLTLAEFMPYGTSDSWPGWRAFIERHVGTAAQVLELANGQALRDAVSGLSENAVNLHYHYIAVYGVGTYNGVAGCWCADGDNFAQGDVLQFYSWDVLGQALPCAALAVEVPMAWHRQSNNTGKDDAGHICGEGMMNELEAHGGADGLMNETYPDAPGFESFLPLADGQVLRYDGHGVDRNAAIVAKGLFGALMSARTQPAVTISNPVEHAKAQALDGLMALYGVKGAA